MCVCVCQCVIILHTICTCVCFNRYTGNVCSLCLSGRVEVSRDFYPEPPSFILSGVSLAPVRSFSWFDLRQNSIPQFHTLSAVDKGLARCSRAPERDTACTPTARKSNSSRQWGPFVELSRMKGPYLARHCFSHHLPVSHCWPEKNKKLI